LGEDRVAACGPFPPPDIGDGEQVGEPIDRGHGDIPVGTVADEQVDECGEPRFSLHRRSRILLFGPIGKQRWQLVPSTCRTIRQSVAEPTPAPLGSWRSAVARSIDVLPTGRTDRGSTSRVRPRIDAVVVSSRWARTSSSTRL
jgi:hypothetical protein